MRLAMVVLLAAAGLAESAPLDDGGLPVTSELVRGACGSCHDSDDQGRMSRISFLRKTPEGWQITLKRMIRTQNLALSPEEAREIVRYLSDSHGLAPAEARPHFYRAERRPRIETVEDEEIEQTCVRCHLAARFLTQRRTEEEWGLLKGMHLGYFPVIEFQTFRGSSPLTGDEPRDEDDGWAVDRVLDKLAGAYPFETPEWRSFQAKRNERGLEGRWLLSTHAPGKGPITGAVSFERSGRDYVYAAEIVLPDGSVQAREGRGVLYAGYSWRGSSSGPGLGEMKEVLMLSEDGGVLEGRFFRGTYGELGIDVTLRRLGRDPEVAAVWPRAAQAGSGSLSVRVLGANLEDVSRLDFGQGIEVGDISERSDQSLTVSLEVTGEALTGYRNLVLDHSQAVDAFAVYDNVDYVKVLPEESLARVGSDRVPKQFAQFEAVAFHRGPDDEPMTDDDLDLGVVTPEWRLEEYHIRHEDDDVRFVGSIDTSGFFTPAGDGPNPDRDLNADNFGDVWVVAEYRPPGADEAVRGRSRLVVTIPVYVYWDLTP